MQCGVCFGLTGVKGAVFGNTNQNGMFMVLLLLSFVSHIELFAVCVQPYFPFPRIRGRFDGAAAKQRTGCWRGMERITVVHFCVFFAACVQCNPEPPSHSGGGLYLLPTFIHQ